MPISFKCPHCGAVTEVADQYAGQTGPCAKCGAAITIPGVASAPEPVASKRGSNSTVIVLLVLAGIVGLCLIMAVPVALLLPALQVAREAARRAQCTNNLKQIGLALHVYHDAHGAFPPASIADENGRPMHSWRVLILPYLEEQALYDRYDFDEPWDGPNNSQLADMMPPVYQCPSGSKQSPFTDYAAISGPGTIFSDADGTRINEIQDSIADTLMVVEASQTNIHWMEPADLNVGEMSFQLNAPGEPCLSSNHPSGVVVLFADSSVQFYSDEFADPEILRAQTTMAAGD